MTELEPRLVEIAHQVFDFAREGDAARLAAYVDHGVPVDLTDADGNTLLMLAAYHGHAESVRKLVERGADVDRLNDRGQSPLAGAVFKGEDDVVAALLEAGADPDAERAGERGRVRARGPHALNDVPAEASRGVRYAARNAPG